MTIEQAMQIAVQHHQGGRLAEAEGVYRQVLAQQPNYPEAHNNLANTLRRRGKLDEAVAAYRRAIALRPNYPEAYVNLGAALRAAGKLDQAISVCRQAIALRPDYADAYVTLGNALKDNGQLDEAIAACARTIELRPDFAEAYINLGNALKDKGRLNEAVGAYRRAVSLKSGFPEAHVNLGKALSESGRLDEAIAAYRHALILRPNYPEACFELGNALKDKGQRDEAIAFYRQAIALRPDYAGAFINYGIALFARGQLDEAAAAYRQAIAVKPNSPEAHSNLGNVLSAKGELDQAIEAYRQAIALKPDYAEAYSNLGNTLKERGHVDDAIAAYSQAISIRPEYAQAHSNLGNAYRDQGRVDEAIAAFRRAIALNPGYTDAHGNLVFAMNFHPAFDAQAIAEELRRWNHQHAESLMKFIRPHGNDRSLERRLRIGYVSPDFRDHAVGRNMLPLIRRHDRAQFEIVCYAQVVRPDAMTEQFRQNADGWRSIVGLTDEQVAEQIRRDGIDILVDLALHTAQNRLPVFARKPAPVQTTFAGYPGSTGLTAIDYRLSDPYVDPPGMDESIYSEHTIRLPDSFWCYDPLDCGDIPVNSLPALSDHEVIRSTAVSAVSSVQDHRRDARATNSSQPPSAVEGPGRVTFGCLNSFCKVNDATLALWGQVLRQVAGSRLLLLSDPGSHCRRTVDLLNREGIDPDRVTFLPRGTRRGYLEHYHRVDIGLDSFPYNGHTTSLDSFWMGVPVVTLVGQTAVSCAGWCQLSNLGLAELAGHTSEQFVTIAVELARDLPRLQQLRSTLRSRMEQSPLMDAARFAQNIEAAYRQMWRGWCDNSGKLSVGNAV